MEKIGGKEGERRISKHKGATAEHKSTAAQRDVARWSIVARNQVGDQRNNILSVSSEVQRAFGRRESMINELERERRESAGWRAGHTPSHSSVYVRRRPCACLFGIQRGPSRTNAGEWAWVGSQKMKNWGIGVLLKTKNFALARRHLRWAAFDLEDC